MLCTGEKLRIMDKGLNKDYAGATRTTGENICPKRDMCGRYHPDPEGLGAFFFEPPHKNNRCKYFKPVKQDVYTPMIRSRFTLYYYSDDNVCILRDRCDETQTMSITNDAEQVVAQLAEHGRLNAETKLIYRDSEGFYDILVHDGTKFVSFKPLETINVNELMDFLVNVEEIAQSCVIFEYYPT